MNPWLPKNQRNEPKLFFLKGKALPLLSAISKKPLLKKKEIKGWKMCTKALKKYLNDPLYKNSFFIMLTSISNAGFGFIFWMLAARFYSTADIGLASAHRYGLDLHALALGFRLFLDF